MLRAIRQGFQIIRLKDLMRKYIRDFKACTIYKHKERSERSNFSLPFIYTGVDFARPFNIKSSNLPNAQIGKA